MPKPQSNRHFLQKPFVERPHLVILGAGASLEALPNGDKHGRELPSMKNLAEVCGIQPILKRHGINYEGGDFEAFFSTLVTAGTHAEAGREIEDTLFSYFSSLELPSRPTLYDHLVLSLRSKDVIATFNWDPFLFQAMARNSHFVRPFTKMPLALFLHGNVAIGCCMRHRPTCIRARGDRCQQCGEPLENSRLLYPVAQKDYNSDAFIAKMWDLVQTVLKDAFMVTFFGYSAPKTDVEAVSLLRAGWGAAAERNLEEIELINTKDEKTVYQTWRPFIHSHHYTYTKCFYDSAIGRHPRRSCDAMFSQIVDMEYIDADPLPRGASWSDLYAWLTPLLEEEQDRDSLRNPQKGLMARVTLALEFWSVKHFGGGRSRVGHDITRGLRTDLFEDGYFRPGKPNPLITRRGEQLRDSETLGVGGGAGGDIELRGRLARDSRLANIRSALHVNLCGKGS